MSQGGKQEQEIMEMHAIIDRDFDSLVEDLRGNIAIPSVLDETVSTAENPFGPRMTEALEDFLRRGRKLGFRSKNLENFAGFLEMGQGEEQLGILCHLDVMPSGERALWHCDPFVGQLRDGRLYGRGTIDDKGPAMASLYAMKAVRDAGVPLRKRVRLVVGLDEESGSRCIRHYLESEKTPSSSFSPDAAFPVVNAEKGILRVRMDREFPETREEPRLVRIVAGDRLNTVPDSAFAVFSGFSEEQVSERIGIREGLQHERLEGQVAVRTIGKAAHAMEPWKGKNALLALLSVIRGIPYGSAQVKETMDHLAVLLGMEFDGRSLGIAASDEISGALSCNPAYLRFENNSFSLRFDIRYPVKADLERLIGQLKNAAECLGCRFSIITHKQPLFVEKESEVVSSLLKAYEEVTGEKGEALGFGGGTYCRFFPNSVSFGPVFPGEEETAHRANEYVDLESLRKMTHIFATAIALLSKEEDE
jgi:succinyl-diaminopimelate desuccinylase